MASALSSPAEQNVQPPVRFSFELPTHRAHRPQEFVTGEAIAELTRAAAAAGFDAVNVTDHPAPDARWLDNGGHHALDPFVALSFAAAADPGLRLLTNIYVPAYRNPLLGAKLVHSLDLLAGGRLILGVAAGYLRPEFRALGIDFDRRGEILDEALAVLDAVFTGDDLAWQGSDFSARGVRFRPVPPSGRRPPVWVGGNSRPAIRRAARFDGWAPFHTGGFAAASRTATIESVDDLAAAIRYVHSQRAGATGPFDICWSEPTLANRATSVDERLDRITALATAGVSWLTVSVPGDTRAEVLDGVAAFGTEIIARTVAA
ncbi:luciferase [Frankia sp. R43]|uniref:TIGR03619 family F420-dependent LLM class oxidoreductase n=1 Tax=Frankia sp. R43 TaxID=269536 RepID=UPI0006CA1C4C|nr:TIGR03619 family F420-dependent LLM class oxidoreductase [Frankia sp. R43]KPM52233.1 luciferase [Frankia sp. R43]